MLNCIYIYECYLPSGNLMVIYRCLMGLYSDLMDYEWDLPSGHVSHSY